MWHLWHDQIQGIVGGAAILMLAGLAPEIIDRGLGRFGQWSRTRVGVSGLVGDKGLERTRRQDGSKGA